MAGDDAVTGLLLLGGASRRFGSDKARFVMEGRTMAERAYSAVRPLVTEVLLSVQAPGTAPPLEGEEVVDRYRGCGPLAGVHAGLLRCRTPWLLVVACDLPHLTTDALRTLLQARAQEHPVVASHDDGYLQPLCAVYPVSMLTLVEALLAERQLAMHALLGRLGRYTPVVLPDVVLRNVNTPADL